MRILLQRGSGHGDVLCLTAALPGLHARYPASTIDVRADPDYCTLLYGHPLIHAVVPSCHDPNLEATYDLVLEPDHGPRWDKAIPRVQCEMLGVPFSPPRLYLHPDELRAAESHTLVLWNWTVEARRYGEMHRIHKLLPGLDVVQIDNGPNLGFPQPCLTLREAAAWLARSTLALGVDTALMHVAAAIGHPQIIVFGRLTGIHNQWIPSTTICSHAQPPEAIADVVMATLEHRPHAQKVTDPEGNVIGEGT